MQVIENDFLKVTIKTKGAELSGLQHKQTGIEYMWQADPAFWGKHSPVLFPVVGALKNNGFLFQGKEYPLGRHGFARDMDFSVAEANGNSVTFRLEASDATLSIFPFAFRFDITYLLNADMLTVTYDVINTGGKELFFSVGGHPAFRVPLEAGLAYENYYLEFDEEENVGRWAIFPESLI